ncbi:MAG TPA: MmgE/PrpD family protein [Ramlibacter sp.]|uniref:MmgE/PrpD family protein n=1 Tax=Ramlibacter sp. TaxID=1917967 RepID=UPI002CD00228|nr:MmgE/PrpD family protein [Ramlibacter sp.]HVZ44919.1 MmgE/PrpD family protein [Ramlibacter sp.]
MSDTGFDATLRTLAAHTLSVTRERLTPAALHATKTLLADSIACAVGAYEAEPCVVSRELARESQGRMTARLIGCGSPTTMEMACFANSVMLRYLDFNDTYTSVGEGHASDMLPAPLALAEGLGASGMDALVGIAAGCEIFGLCTDTFGLAERGWDHGFFIVLASVAAAGSLLRLDEAQLCNAFAIAASANVPTRQTRRGELSMWKGCATAASAREGLFAALLAQRGMTGPPRAFEGRHGVFDQVTGPFILPPVQASPGRFGVERTGLKWYPTEYHSHVPLAMVQQLRTRVALQDIERIHVETYQRGWSEVGDEPERWDPRTRETADHSLPFMLAAILADGELTLESFREARIADPELRPIMRRISVSENPEFTRMFPRKLHARVTITARDGSTHSAEADYPRGHQFDPLTGQEADAKFDALCVPLMGQVRSRELREAIHSLDSAPGLEKMMDLAAFDARPC